MDRRRFLLTSLAGALAAPLAAEAQQARKIPRVGGVCMGPCLAPSAASYPFIYAFKSRLRELGWVEGQNVEFRILERTPDRLSESMAELVRTGIDVILALDNERVIAAKQATSTIPIVMVYGLDPVATGLVASLDRPGGNNRRNVGPWARSIREEFGDSQDRRSQCGAGCNPMESESGGPEPLLGRARGVCAKARFKDSTVRRPNA
jgi:ABC transporter substrate binding protein